MVFDDAGNQLRAKASIAAAFGYDDESAGFRNGFLDGLKIERVERSEVPKLTFQVVFFLQILDGFVGPYRHFPVGHYGGVISLASQGRLPDIAIVRVEGDG